MIIYKTTNLINGKIYIGQDSNNNPNYYGSGTLFKEALCEYGKENFRKEILEHCDTHKELNEAEIYWISAYHVLNPKIGYNLHNGGSHDNAIKIPYDILYLKYIYERKSITEISHELSHSQEVISKALKEHNIKRTRCPLGLPLSDIFNKYTIEGKSMQEIALKYKVSPYMIRVRLKLMGILFNKIEINKDELIQLYITENKTINEIAEKYKVKRESIKYRLKKFNIPIKNKEKKQIVTKEDIIELYFNQLKTKTEIAEELHITTYTYFKKYNIKTRLQIDTRRIKIIKEALNRPKHERKACINGKWLDENGLLKKLGEYRNLK